MVQKLTLGGIAGGLVCFVWSFFSWTVLPWHLATLEKFNDEDIVAGALRANAEYKGVYVLPNIHKRAPGKEAEYNRVSEEAAKERMRTGPFAFVAITPAGVEPEMGSTMVLSLAIQLLAGILMTYLLLQTSNLSYGQRVLFVTVVATTGGVLCHLPYWTWWGFSTGFTLVALADLIIGWSLAGLAMAKIVSNEPPIARKEVK